jgi:hypothetical protein
MPARAPFQSASRNFIAGTVLPDKTCALTTTRATSFPAACLSRSIMPVGHGYRDSVRRSHTNLPHHATRQKKAAHNRRTPLLIFVRRRQACQRFQTPRSSGRFPNCRFRGSWPSPLSPSCYSRGMTSTSKERSENDLSIRKNDALLRNAQRHRVPTSDVGTRGRPPVLVCFFIPFAIGSHFQRYWPDRGMRGRPQTDSVCDILCRVCRMLVPMPCAQKSNNSARQWSA